MSEANLKEVVRKLVATHIQKLKSGGNLTAENMKTFKRDLQGQVTRLLKNRPELRLGHYLKTRYVTNLNHNQIIAQMKNVSAGITTPEQFTQALANKGYDVSQQEHGKIRIRKKGFIQTFKETRAAANAQRTANMSKLQNALARNYTFTNNAARNKLAAVHLNKLRAMRIIQANMKPRQLNEYLGRYYNLGTVINNKRSITNKKGFIQQFKESRKAASNKRNTNSDKLSNVLSNQYTFGNNTTLKNAIIAAHLNKLRAMENFTKNTVPKGAFNAYLKRFYVVASRPVGSNAPVSLTRKKGVIETFKAARAAAVEAKGTAATNREAYKSILSNVLSNQYTFDPNNKTLKNAIIAAHLNKLQANTTINLSNPGALNAYLYKHYNIGTRSETNKKPLIMKKPTLRNRRGTNANEVTRARARVQAFVNKNYAKTVTQPEIQENLKAALNGRYTVNNKTRNAIMEKHFNKIRTNKNIKLNTNEFNITQLNKYLARHYNVGQRPSGNTTGKVRIMEKPRFRIPGGNGQQRVKAFENKKRRSEKLSQLYTFAPNNLTWEKIVKNHPELLETNKNNVNVNLGKYYNVAKRQIGNPSLVTSKKFGKDASKRTNLNKLSGLLNSSYNFSGNSTIKNTILKKHLKQLRTGKNTRSLFANQLPTNAKNILNRYLLNSYNIGERTNTKPKPRIMKKPLKRIPAFVAKRTNRNEQERAASRVRRNKEREDAVAAAKAKAMANRQQRIQNIASLRLRLNQLYNFKKNTAFRNAIVNKHFNKIHTIKNNTRQLNTYLAQHYNIGSRSTTNPKPRIMKKPIIRTRGKGEQNRAKARVNAIVEKEKRRREAAAKAAAPVAAPAAEEEEE